MAALTLAGELRPGRAGSNRRQDLPVYLHDFRRLSCQGAYCELNSHGSPASPAVTPAPRRCSWDTEIGDSPASPTVTPAPRRCSWDTEIDDCGGDRRRA